MANKNRCIIYTRVSTDEQATKGRSIETQEANCRRHATERDYEVIGVYCDDGLSGKDLHRPGIQQAFGTLALNGADILLISDFDRLTREVEDKCLIAKLMKTQGWSIESLCENVDIDTAQGNLNLNMKVMFSQYEREMARERTCRVLNAKRERGEKLGGMRKYGYQEEERDGVKYLAPDPHEQRTIERICDLRDAGMTLSAICRELRRRKIRSRNGTTSWNPMTISRILQRAGIRVSNRKTRIDKGRRRMEKTDKNRK